MNGEDQEVGLDRRHYYLSAEGPFQNTGSIFLHYGGGDRGRIVDTIERSVLADDPLAHVHGESGSGKTLMSLLLAERLGSQRNLIRFEQDALDAGTLLQQLGSELCPQSMVSDGTRRDRHASGVGERLLQAILAQLATGTPGQRPILLIIDSPAAAGADVLALLGRLGEVRRDGRRMLQTVLFERIDARASRELGVHRGVNQPENHYWLRRLTLAEVSDYLHHHMTLFDYNRRDTFTREMAYFIADRSEGVFRAINTIARNAFMLASLENRDRPSMSHLLVAGLPPRAPAEPAVRFSRRHRRGVVVCTGAALALVLLGGVMLLLG